jgi:hypothetical protein
MEKQPGQSAQAHVPSKSTDARGEQVKVP